MKFFGTSSKQLATKDKEHTNYIPPREGIHIPPTRKGKKGTSSFQNKCRLVEDLVVEG